jgi:type II secretory pathway pseudopilin PulG
MLVVIAIIGILAAAGLPAIKGMSKSNSMAAANRQLLDDLAYARSSAMANHTTVYVVFVPPYITNPNYFQTNNLNSNQMTLVTNLYAGQYTTYSMVALRSVGDQPGVKTPRYLTGWHALPNGVYIATNMFADTTALGFAPPFLNVTNTTATALSFPFPTATNTQYGLFPYIAFNYLGQLVYSVGGVEVPLPSESANLNNPQAPNYELYIPLVRGSIFYSGFPPVADIVETPTGNAYYTNYSSYQAQNNQPFTTGAVGAAYNQIFIDPLTGRARAEHPEIQ